MSPNVQTGPLPDPSSDPSPELAAQIRRLRELIYGNWQTCVTFAFAELNLADLLADGERPVADLAQATATNPDALARFLRCAAGLALVVWKPKTQRYALAPLGELLTTHHPHSQRAAAQLNGADYRYMPWGHLVEILRQGNSAGFSPTYATGSLDWLAGHPDHLAVFHRAMTDLSSAENRALAHAYDFGPFTHLLDIGCGQGTLLMAILREHAHLSGTLFDLETALPPMTIALAHEFGPRLRRRPGDFFQEVPAGADLYIMKNVIHNWPEARALQLLQHVRRALLGDSPTDVMEAGKRLRRENGQRLRQENGQRLRQENGQGSHKRLLIIENLLTEGPSLAAWLDLNFMVLVDGRERTLEEYRSLGQRAGLHLMQNIPTATGRQILEFVAIP